MAKKNILFISSSKAVFSKSRKGLNFLVDSLKHDPNLVQLRDNLSFDIVDLGLDSENEKRLQECVEIFQKADGLVIASPVFNWSVTDNLFRFLNNAIDSENGKQFIPVMRILGAGSTSSVFADESLNRALMLELNAVIVGKPCVMVEASFNNFGKNNVSLKPEIELRLANTFSEFLKIVLK